jgi:protein-S-isoprenylcysteine O-methyltransferase Ste14
MSAGGQRLGSVLVALQFALMALIAWLAGPGFVRGPVPVAAWAIGLGAVALGLWALSANRPGNFNIRPIPKPGGQLVQTGPYRWIRHPMYTSILLAAVAGLLGADADQRLAVAAAGAALAAVLWVKAGLEERWMVAHHPAYAAYILTTRRFVPGLV